jgi:hypothetical protein
VANGTSESSVYGSGALVTRENGGTAGVSSKAGHSVFTSSVAPTKARTTHRAHVATHAVTPSPRTATGDVWSGFAATSRSPLSAAASYSGSQGGGLSSQVLAGMLVLGLGLTGVCGGAFAVTTSRRRKVAAARAGKRNKAN